MNPRLRHVMEYRAVTALAAVFVRLPYRLALAAGCAIAALLFVVLRSRMREAERRLRQVFGPAAPGTRVVWTAWRNLVFAGIDAVRAARMKPEEARRMADLGPMLHAIRAATAGGRGAVLGTAHMGSWELLGAALSRHGVPFFSIAGRQRNPLLNDYINRLREAGGMEILTRGESPLRPILHRLRKGGVFGVLCDVRSRTPGIRVPLFGSEANVSPGPALFARLADVPIVPCFPRRIGWTRHELVPFDPIRPDPALSRDEDCYRMTRELFAIIDREIRRHPDQWFWFNRRWILDPIGESGDSPAADAADSVV